MRDDVHNWIGFAYEDLKMAELGMEEEIFNQVCFHSQQAAEKAIKALIIHKGHVHPQTHKLADLLRYLGGDVFDTIKDEIISLDRFYIPTRYPDALPGCLPDGLPNKKDAYEALEIAKMVFGKVKMELTA